MKPSQCNGCYLERSGFGFFPKEGVGKLGIKLVFTEIEQGDANRGKVLSPWSRGGSVWQEVIGKLGYDWNCFEYESLLKCQPKFSGVKGKEFVNDCCKRHGFGQSEEDRVSLILAVGIDAFRVLSGMDGYKKQLGIGYLHGFVFKTEYGYVMPIDNLEMVKKGQFYLQHQVERDVEKAVRFVNGLWKPFEELQLKEYILDATEDDGEMLLEMLVKNPNKWLAYDIEGEGLEMLDEDEKEMKDYEVYTIQFAVEKHKAFEFRVKDKPKLWNVVEKLLETQNKKVGANVWLFDNQVLEGKGIKINGQIIDTQWLFKHYYPGDVRKHLQTTASFAEFPFPWKHRIGELNSIYPCADVDALRYVYPWLRDRCKAMKHSISGWSLWDGYERHYVKKWAVMKRASERGIVVDRKQWEKLKRRLEKVRESYERKILDSVPMEVRKWKEYKTKPKKVREIEKWVERKYGREVIRKKNRIVVKIAKKYGYWFVDGKWKLLLPFKLSKQQVEAYVDWNVKNAKTKKEASKWKLMVNRKTGKTTTGKRSLELLAKRTNDRLLNMFVENRSLGTTIDNMLSNWEPRADGKVHTTFDFSPVQGQMASYKPNILNASNHTRIGQLFRWVIYSRTDEWFVEFDMKSFHMAMMGFLAESRKYYRFSQIDAHSLFWANVMYGYEVEWEKSDEYLKGLCKDWRKDKEFAFLRTVAAKPTTLGNQLGLGPKKLYEQNQPYVKSEQHAKELQQKLAKMFPEVERWKKAIRLEAHRNKYLMTYYGRIQRFYQVYKTDWIESWKARKYEEDRVMERKGSMIMVRSFGFEHDKAPALPLQGNSFGYMDEKILELDRLGFMEKYGFVNSIHDGLTFFTKAKDKAIEEIYEVLMRPSDVLVNDAFPEGFKVGVEVKVGKNWRNYGKGNPFGMKEIGGKG